MVKKRLRYVHDYPATCWNCWDKLSNEDKLLRSKAEVLPPHENSTTPGILDDYLDDYDDYDDDYYSFGQAFEASCTADGTTYNVSIQDIFGENGGKDNYYTIAYTDGSSKDITFEAGTGWVEIGIGQTPHSIELGNLIEIHFIQDPNKSIEQAQERAEDFEVSDIEVGVEGEPKVFSIVHNAAEYNINIEEALRYWVRNNKKYGVQAFCDYMTKVVPGVICVPKGKS